MSLSLLNRQYYPISNYIPCICCVLLNSSETKIYISQFQENDQTIPCDQLTVIQHIHSFSFITKCISAIFQKFSTNYSEKHVPGSLLFFYRLIKQSNRFELDSNAKNVNYNNNKFIFLMPDSSSHNKMKLYRHLKTNYNKIFKEHLSNPAYW